MKITNKLFLGLLLSVAIILPASAKALSYGRGMMGTTISTNNSDVVYQAQPVDSQKIQDYMFKLQNGNLNADEQKEMYGLINTPPLMMGSVSAIPALGGQQFGYRTMMATPFSMMSGYNNQFVWYSLMCVITVILLWAVLLLSIVALYRWIKLKKHIN
ncbi:MAG: hypothetical protein WC794_04665 [Candidatus Doudnabacteria bacterium]